MAVWRSLNQGGVYFYFCGCVCVWVGGDFPFLIVINTVCLGSAFVLFCYKRFSPVLGPPFESANDCHPEPNNVGRQRSIDFLQISCYKRLSPVLGPPFESANDRHPEPNNVGRQRSIDFPQTSARAPLISRPDIWSGGMEIFKPGGSILFFCGCVCVWVGGIFPFSS